MMKHFLLFFLLGVSLAGAEAATPTPLTLPAVSVQQVVSDTLVAVPSAPLVYQVAKTVRVQPDRLETRVQPGYSTGNLTFSLFSEVNAQVTVKSDDPRLIIRGAEGGHLRLFAYELHNVNAVALEPHSGHLTVTNSLGEVIARVPYVIAPSKAINQNFSLNYTPSGERTSASYSISGVTRSPLDPRWSVGVGAGVSLETGQVNGGVSIGVNW